MQGVATLLAAILGGPSTLAVYQRADWSLGFQDRYFWAEPGQDSFVGRCCALLKIYSSDFGYLPPHFERNLTIFENGQGWADILPCYTGVPQHFRHLLPFMLASLTKHYDYLDQNLDAAHPLRHSQVWVSGILRRLIPHVQTGNFENVVTGMKATGIPPSVVQLKAIDELKEQVRQYTMTAEANHKRLIQELPEAITIKLLDNIQVNGAAPLTADRVTGIITGAIEQSQATMLAAMTKMFDNRVGAASSAPSGGFDGASQATGAQHPNAAFKWADGTLHNVPEGFVLAKYVPVYSMRLRRMNLEFKLCFVFLNSFSVHSHGHTVSAFCSYFSCGILAMRTARYCRTKTPSWRATSWHRKEVKYCCQKSQA